MYVKYFIVYMYVFSHKYKKCNPPGGHPDVCLESRDL